MAKKYCRGHDIKHGDTLYPAGAALPADVVEGLQAQGYQIDSDMPEPEPKKTTKKTSKKKTSKKK